MLKTFWKPHKSKGLNFLHRNCTQLFCSTPKNIFSEIDRFFCCWKKRQFSGKFSEKWKKSKIENRKFTYENRFFSKDFPKNFKIKFSKSFFSKMRRILTGNFWYVLNMILKFGFLCFLSRFLLASAELIFYGCWTHLLKKTTVCLGPATWVEIDVWRIRVPPYVWCLS